MHPYMSEQLTVLHQRQLREDATKKARVVRVTRPASPARAGVDSASRSLSTSRTR
jgi:hypothetical protein